MFAKGEKETVLSCSFTGHRKIEPRHAAGISNLLSRAINFAYSNGCRRFLCGGALGFDTLAAREVIKYRITHPDVLLVLVLPCINQSERWPRAEREKYEYTLSVSDEIIYVSEEYTDTCIKERNRRLVDSADIVIAYLSNERSGTGQTVRMAKAAGKRVYNLYPELEKQV